jgi:flagellar basal body-associated protein FliL
LTLEGPSAEYDGAKENAMSAHTNDPLANPLLKVLAIVAGLLLLGIAAGTVYGLAAGTRQQALARDRNQPAPGYDIFDLGQIRTKSADAQPSVIAARLSFPYPATDLPFKEELMKKAPALKAAALGFFSAKKAEELHPAYEGVVKAGLRDAFNAVLSLGSIREVWLADFAVVK